MSALEDKNQIAQRAAWDEMLEAKKNRDLSARTPWEMFEDEGYTTLDDVLERGYVEEQLLPKVNENFEEAFRVMNKNGWITSSSQKLPPTTYNTTSSGASFSLGLGARNGFTEVVRRNSGRYEMRYGTSSPPFTDNVVRENKTLHDCLKKIFKEEYYLLGCSVVISTKDSKEQQWHVDGGHVDSKEHKNCHCLNVFIPLIDLTPSLGPTEIRPGTHYYSRDLAKMMLGAKIRGELQSPVAPCVKAGSAILFDYRVLHRGLANIENEDRPILVLTYAKSWFKDIFNFPGRSFMDRSEVVEYFCGRGIEECESLRFEDGEMVFNDGGGVDKLIIGGNVIEDEGIRDQLVKLKKIEPKRIMWILGTSDLGKGEFTDLGSSAMILKKTLYIHGSSLDMSSSKLKICDIIDTLIPSEDEMEVNGCLVNLMQKNKITRIFTNSKEGFKVEEGKSIGYDLMVIKTNKNKSIKVGEGWTEWEEGGKKVLRFSDSSCNK
ncbi:hypothetical protein TrLO_g8318 [Triparma laevis f. longispina]|uniref:Uncharacterized protein n=1 Tax=Triparma laevis f. longispina TaxID=1714387 RepID=A0A9W7F1U9_9STRA|nr:hypothetical protein TrLO_g8318 [Triparma laevis f. longispina]